MSEDSKSVWVVRRYLLPILQFSRLEIRKGGEILSCSWHDYGSLYLFVLEDVSVEEKETVDFAVYKTNEKRVSSNKDLTHCHISTVENDGSHYHVFEVFNIGFVKEVV